MTRSRIPTTMQRFPESSIRNDESNVDEEDERHYDEIDPCKGNESGENAAW